MKQLWQQLQLGRESAEKLVTAENADVAVKRWQALSRKKATLEGGGRTFESVAGERMKVAA